MTLEKARELRSGMTRSEVLLWTALRRNQIEGARFKRQVPIGPYVVDFACLSLKLVVEVDGESHDLTVAADARRTAFLETRGFEVIRFSNEDVRRNLEGVVEAIRTSVPNRQRTRRMSGGGPLSLTLPPRGEGTTSSDVLRNHPGAVVGTVLRGDRLNLQASDVP